LYIDYISLVKILNLNSIYIKVINFTTIII